ncbi:LLM class flavin-dependent oxidoreductase [Rhodococcus jostii]|uniref:Luciferase-like monooxygenase n=1 Tax=Rhodococcus jostii TaxID=132919 RepID=A0A1H4T8Z4_RHOJO|nr:LLM class flavin-dependent oxidoreductase [Rhodococcus jostii]SEC52614.1 Luciferase-like monooxygenase [Rhodococcus jostii]
MNTSTPGGGDAATAQDPTDSPSIAVAVVAAPAASGAGWVDDVRRIEDQGYSGVLVPDTLWTVSPFPALAAAGAVTRTLTLRSWVLAAPLRSRTALVREVKALHTLSDGRFELGIGVGRPDAESEAGRLGLPWPSGAERRRQLEDAVRAVHDEVDPDVPVVVAASGPRMLATAGRVADRIAPALSPLATENELADAIARVRSSTGRPVHLTQSLVGFGDHLPTWYTRSGMDVAQLVEAGAVGFPAGDPDGVAWALIDRSRRYGIDEYTVPGELSDAFIPILERLGART